MFEFGRARLGQFDVLADLFDSLLNLIATDLRAAIVVEVVDPAQRNQWPLGDRPLPFEYLGVCPGDALFILG
jgi:hypothetical protein